MRSGEMDFARFAGNVKRNAAWGMARGVDHIDLEIAPAQGVALFEKMIDFGERRRTETEKIGLLIHGIVEWEIVVVHHDRRAGVLVELGEAADVIDVGVRADDGFDGEFVAADEIEKAFHFVAGVENDGFAGFGVADYGAIALKNTDGDLDVDEFGVGSVQGADDVGWVRRGSCHSRIIAFSILRDGEEQPTVYSRQPAAYRSYVRASSRRPKLWRRAVGESWIGRFGRLSWERAYWLWTRARLMRR